MIICKTLLDAENLTTITSDILGSSANKDKVTEGIRFLLSHFQAAGQQLFPRKVSSAISDGRQFTVRNKEQILQECENANYIDCRLNAYALLDDGALMAPTIIFIDIDGISKPESDKILKRTLKMTKLKLNGYVPTERDPKARIEASIKVVDANIMAYNILENGPKPSNVN